MIAVEVIKLREHGEFFASIFDGANNWNAPGGTPQQATLNAWTSWTAHRADTAAMIAAFFATDPEPCTLCGHQLCTCDAEYERALEDLR